MLESNDYENSVVVRLQRLAQLNLGYDLNCVFSRVESTNDLPAARDDFEDLWRCLSQKHTMDSDYHLNLDRVFGTLSALFKASISEKELNSARDVLNYDFGCSLAEKP